MSGSRQTRVFNNTMTTIKTYARIWNLICCVCASGVAHSTHATANGGMVVVPIPSISVDNNNCNTWQIKETYTAVPVPSSVLEQLIPNEWVSTGDHFHYEPGQGGSWRTPYGMRGTPSDKLRTINAMVFGTYEPTVGMTKTITVSHRGGCAADHGMRECVGIFVAPTMGKHWTKDPVTFPMGLCSGIPPTGVSCQFESPDGTVSLGSGGRGSRGGTTAVHVSCSRPVVYRVSELPGPADPASLQIVTLTVQGAPLPYVSPGTQATENLIIEVEAKVSSEGFLSTQRVLRIDIP